MAIDWFQSYRVIIYLAFMKWTWWNTNSFESWLSMWIYDCARISTSLKDFTIRKNEFQSIRDVRLGCELVAIIIINIDYLEACRS